MPTSCATLQYCRCSSYIKLRLRNYLITWLYSKVCQLCSVWLQPLYGTNIHPPSQENDGMTGVTRSGCTLQGFVFSTSFLILEKLVEHCQGPCVLSLLRRVSLCCSAGMSTTSCSLRIGMDQKNLTVQSVFATLRFSFAAKAPGPS